MSEFISGVEEKYDKRLLTNRIKTEAAVIGCVFKDPLIIDDTNLRPDMFITIDGRFYISLAIKLRKQKLNVFDEVGIMSNIDGKILDGFYERGGYEQIDNMISVVNLENSESYLDSLYKSNIILQMYADGFSLFKPITYNDKEIEPYKLFEKFTAQEVVSFFEMKLSEYDVGNESEVLEEGILDFDDEWLESMEEGEDCGVPYDQVGIDIEGNPINGYKFLSNQTNGIPVGLSMICGFSSAGKSTFIIPIILSMIYRGEKVLIISNEEKKKTFMAKIMVYLLNTYCKYYGLTKKKLVSGNITEEDKKRIKMVREYWNKNYRNNFFFIQINDANMNVVSRKSREYILKLGVSTIVYDTFKMEEKAMDSARTDLHLVLSSRILDRIARKYNVHVIATVQLAEAYKNALWLNASCLSNSKQVKEVCQLMLMIRPTLNDELKQSNKLYCNPFRLKTDENDKWYEQKCEPDITKPYRTTFIEKNRYGEDSNGNSVCYLFAFTGDYSKFSESYQCRPKRGSV